MSRDASPWLDPEIATYVAARSTPADDVLRDLIEETATSLGPAAGMQISASQGALMQMLVRLTGAKRAVEVGTFTGFSALCIARALPDDGHLLCCDVNEEWTAIARRYWERAGVAHKIELRIAPALETLATLPPDEPIDLAFIDADKSNYGGYYEALLARLRPNGLILVDNTLWSGTVVKPEAADDSKDTKALRSFNDAVAADMRVESYILPIGDGVTVIRKR